MSHKRVAEIPECCIPRAQLKQLFDVFDVEHTGYIDARELKAGLRALGCPITADQIREGLRALNHTDISAPITFELFCMMAEPLLPSRHSKESYRQLFGLLGGDDVGYLTVDHLRQVCDELGENISEDDLRAMVAEADLDGDGKVSVDEFIRMMNIANDPLADC